MIDIRFAGSSLTPAVALCRYLHYTLHLLLTASSQKPHLALWMKSICIIISMFIINSRRCPGLAPATRFSWAFIGADTWSYSISNVVITPDKLTPIHQLRVKTGSPGIEPGRCFPQASSFEKVAGVKPAFALTTHLGCFP